MEHITLRGLIISQYESLANFAKAIGWSPRKVSFIVNGHQEPTASDIEKMAMKLRISIPAEIQQIFFTPPSTNCRPTK